MACLSRYLDAPYVLSTGLHGATQLAWGVEPETFLVSTPTGTLEVDREGKVRPVPHPMVPEPEVVPGSVKAIETDGEPIWIDVTGALRQGDDTVFVRGLVAPRALTMDRKGRVYVVAGEPDPALYRWDGRSLERVAEWVGPVVDTKWGPGGWLRPEYLYLLRGDGVLAYLEPPP